MSLLWSGKECINKVILFAYHKNPSPTHQKNVPDPARDSESSWAGGNVLLSVLSSFIKGTSLPASFLRRRNLFTKKLCAGMTVEASIVLPLFLFFFLNLGCAIELIRLHGNLQLALWQTGSRLSVYGYAVYSQSLPQKEQGDGEKKNGEAEESGETKEMKEGWWQELAGVAFASAYVKAKVIELAGRDYLENAPLKRGADSLQLWESEVFGSGDEIDLVLTYSVAPWSTLAGFFSFRMANRYYAHIWNGYQIPIKTEESRAVFVTENGSVYHLDRGCTHLQLSVRQVSPLEVKGMRNQYGRNYQACEKCVGETQTAVWYITSQGDRYHSTRTCPGLTRNVRVMELKEAVNSYRPCSRCGGE